MLLEHYFTLPFYSPRNMRHTTATLFRNTSASLLRGKMLSQYEQEAFESHRRFLESTSYPGPIRAATPGDTRFYDGSIETILNENERHYWRAVVDDPRVELLLPLRVRFKTNVWVTTGWEKRLQIVQVMVPRDATVSELIDLVRVENASPYLCTTQFKLALDGVELENRSPICAYNVSENTQLDAIECDDHVEHTDAVRPKDWNVDEMTVDDVSRSPYKEMGVVPVSNLAPRYEARPSGYFGKNNYSGMKKSSS